MKLQKIAILSAYSVPIVALCCLLYLAGVYLHTSHFTGSENELRLVAWNIESGGNDPQVIANQISDFSDYDVVALNEVRMANIKTYMKAMGSNFDSFVSSTGRSDRLAIFWDRVRFELISKVEMNQHGNMRLNDGNHRSPIFVRLKDRVTGRKFILMTNHLARRNKQLRKEQAAGLREWARDSNEPIIAMGDFNFDYSFGSGSGNDSFSEFMKDGIWRWVKPSPMIDSNFSDTDGDGKDNYPDSMLDFVFLANGARDFDCKCSIVQRDGDFPDDESTSDHRATELRLVY